jgi:hypothetical protein
VKRKGAGLHMQTKGVKPCALSLSFSLWKVERYSKSWNSHGEEEEEEVECSSSGELSFLGEF